MTNRKVTSHGLFIVAAAAMMVLVPATSVADLGGDAQNMLDDGPDRYLVGFHELPNDREQYQGDPVVKVDENLQYFLVETENPTMLKIRANFDDRVRYVEEERYDWQLNLVPNDPFYTHDAHWGTQRIGAETAWDTTTGSSAILVAHIDSGLNKGHEDIDNYLQGFDFINGDSEPEDVNSCNYHGTHTTGTAGSPINNGLGFAGISQHTILPVKIFAGGFFGCGTSTTAITDALQYAADQGSHLSSNSWGGGSFSTAIDDAITYAHNKGTIHVAAAGNSGPCSDCVGEPWRSAPERSIVVSSLTDGDIFSDFSSEGPQVDVIAPGDFIGAACGGTSDYCGMSGTSMAAPHVTGALALYMAATGNTDYATVTSDLAATAENLGFSADRQGDGLVRADLLVAGGGGTPTNSPPTASFTFSCTDLTCDFDGTGSTDSDGSISSYSWDFGDGNTATGSTVTHTFGSGGDYTVTLTVTDDDGATDTDSQVVSVSDGTSGGITLDATGYKVKGRHHADLTWSGATSTNVDVYVNGALDTTTANDGFHTWSSNNRGGASYDFQVCEAGTSTCSNVATVNI